LPKSRAGFGRLGIMVSVAGLVLAVAAVGLGEVTTLAGTPFQFGELLGKGPVVLVFWNSWLPDSESFAALLPELDKEMARRGWQGALILFQDEPAAAGLLGSSDRLVPLADRRGELVRRFQVTRAPAVVLLNAEGAVLGRAGHDRESVLRLLAQGAGQ